MTGVFILVPLVVLFPFSPPNRKQELILQNLIILIAELADKFHKEIVQPR